MLSIEVVLNGVVDEPSEKWLLARVLDETPHVPDCVTVKVTVSLPLS